NAGAFNDLPIRQIHCIAKARGHWGRRNIFCVRDEAVAVWPKAMVEVFLHILFSACDVTQVITPEFRTASAGVWRCFSGSCIALLKLCCISSGASSNPFCDRPSIMCFAIRLLAC